MAKAAGRAGRTHCACAALLSWNPSALEVIPKYPLMIGIAASQLHILRLPIGLQVA
jgi:hypothetical protein